MAGREPPTGFDLLPPQYECVEVSKASQSAPHPKAGIWCETGDSVLAERVR